MMNQKAVWWGVGAVAVVAIVAGVALTRPSDTVVDENGAPVEDAGTTTSSNTPGRTSGSVKGGTSAGTSASGASTSGATASGPVESLSFADLMNRGGTQVCYVSHATTMGTTTGTVYIADKNLRADYVVDAPILGKISTYTISDGTNIYAWSSLSTQGYRFPVLEALRAGAPAQSQRTSQTSSFSDKMDVTCKAWKADSSKFALPASITFSEYSTKQP